MSLPLLRSPIVRAFLRGTLLLLALPCVYLGGASAAFFYRQRHTGSNAAGNLRLAALTAPTSHTRLLVFAPHCDDETLGNAGLIQQTLASGGGVRAVILTNGDGFRTAVECQSHKLNPEPQDYLVYAALRQQETVRAVERLGLHGEDVAFLGYPDGGLMALWNDHWLPAHPYTSRTTGVNYSPYTRAFHPKATYCGESLLDDIKTTLRQFHPTLVTVTHPGEDHSDHEGAAAFVMLALRQLQNDPREAGWARQTRLRCYLIHRGDWPLPQTDDARAPLLPPAAMTHGDTRWQSLPLTPAQTARKAESIRAYASQTAMMGRFLMAFARQSELFGDLRPVGLPVVPDTLLHSAAQTADWNAVPPIVVDPTRDNLQRDLLGDGDIQTVYACRDSRNLYIRLDCRQPLTSRFTYVVRLRGFGADNDTPEQALTLRLRPTTHSVTRPDGIQTAARDRTLQVSIPWNILAVNNLSPTLLALDAQTLLAGWQEVDRTGIRLLAVDNSSQSLPATQTVAVPDFVGQSEAR